MAKQFEIKIYEKDGTFKQVVNPKNVTTDVSFTEELNGGQGNLSISFVGDPDSVISSDIVEVREVDTENKVISKTYTGIIEEVDITEYKENEVVTLSILGVFTALNDVKYKDAGNRTFTKSGTPGAIVKLIIDSFNADYGVLTGDTQNLTTNLIRYSGSSVDITGTTVDRSFANEDCLTAIKKTLEDTGFDFYIGADGVIHVTQDANQTEKTLTMGREVISIPRKYHKRDMVNTYYLTRDGGTELTYTDAWSIALYGKKEQSENDSSILDATTQNLLGGEKLTNYAYERAQITVNTKPMQSESIRPGDLLTVQNTKRPFTAQKITRITKNTNGFTISVGDFVSFGKSVTGG